MITDGILRCVALRCSLPSPYHVPTSIHARMRVAAAISFSTRGCLHTLDESDDGRWIAAHDTYGRLRVVCYMKDDRSTTLL